MASASALPLAVTMGDACGIGPEIVAKWFRSDEAGAAQHADVADDERSAGFVGAEPLGDDLGADAARIAHRDGERQGGR